MPFSIQKTNASVLGKEETIYYVEAHKWTTIVEDRTVFDTREAAEAVIPGSGFADSAVVEE